MRVAPCSADRRDTKKFFEIFLSGTSYFNLKSLEKNKVKNRKSVESKKGF